MWTEWEVGKKAETSSKVIPASGLLNRQFPLPRTLFPRQNMAHSLILFKSLLKHHFSCPRYLK